jgi:hypothetical protein
VTHTGGVPPRKISQETRDHYTRVALRYTRPFTVGDICGLDAVRDRRIECERFLNELVDRGDLERTTRSGRTTWKWRND